MNLTRKTFSKIIGEFEWFSCNKIVSNMLEVRTCLFTCAANASQRGRARREEDDRCD